MRPVTETSTLLADGLFGRLTNARENFRSVLTGVPVNGERNELQAAKPRAVQVKQEIGNRIVPRGIVRKHTASVGGCVQDRILQRDKYHSNRSFEPF